MSSQFRATPYSHSWPHRGLIGGVIVCLLPARPAVDRLAERASVGALSVKTRRLGSGCPRSGCGSQVGDAQTHMIDASLVRLLRCADDLDVECQVPGVGVTDQLGDGGVVADSMVGSPSLHVGVRMS